MTNFTLDSSPSVVLELTLRLKIRDVMTTELILAEKKDSLRHIQQLMKQNRITGVPIVEGKRLVGMVSVDDIIQALDGGYIDDPCDHHMSRQLIVLEDDMPLSLGISFFEKYHFGRFPVLNKNNELVGIVTSRDILTSLLMEMNKEMEHLEEKLAPQKEVPPECWSREFTLHKFDFEHAGSASGTIKKEIKDKGLDPKNLRRIAVASYEMEMNLIVHSLGGTLKVEHTPEHTILEATDVGPGIEDVDKAMMEGWSTANDWIRSLGFGAGMGLPNIKRVSDEFFIQSQVGKGTLVRSIIYHPPEKEVTHEHS